MLGSHIALRITELLYLFILQKKSTFLSWEGLKLRVEIAWDPLRYSQLSSPALTDTVNRSTGLVAVI